MCRTKINKWSNVASLQANVVNQKNGYGMDNPKMTCIPTLNNTGNLPLCVKCTFNHTCTQANTEEWTNMSENVTPVEADPKITHIVWHIPPHPTTHTHTLWINPLNCDTYPSQGICRGRWRIRDKEKFIREEEEEEEIKINNVHRTTVQDKIFWVLVTKPL